MDFGLGLILSFTDNATAGINSAANSLTRLTTMAEQSSSAINNLADISALSSLSMVAGQLGDTFLSVGNTITGVFQSLLSNTMSTGSQFESFRVTLNALLKDSEKAEEAMSRLMNFAATTPFEITDLTGMFTTITANGLDAFQTLSGATSGYEQELLGFIGDLMAFRPDVPAQQWGVAIRNAFSGEVRSLKNALDVNVVDMLGRDWGDTPEQIAQDFADLADALGVAGLMVSNMGTWSQTLSNVSDQFTRFFLAVADVGVFNELKQALTNVAGAIMAIPDDQMKAIATVIADSVSFIVKPIVRASEVIGNFITKVVEFTETRPKLAKFIIQMVALAGVLLTIVGVSLKVISSFAGLATVFLAMGGSFVSLRATLVSGLKLISARILPLGLAVGGLYAVWKTDFGGIRTLVTSFVENVRTSFTNARNAVDMSVSGMSAYVNELQSKGDFWSNITLGLMKLMVVGRALSDLWNSEDGLTLSEDTFLKARELGILPLIEAILDLKYRFDLFKEGFIAGFNEVSNNLKSFISTIQTNVEGTFIDTALEGLTVFLEKLTGSDAEAWYTFGESIGRFATNAVLLFTAFSMFKKVSSIFTGIFGIVKPLMGLIVAHPIVALIVGIVGALALLYSQSEGFRDLVGEIFGTLQETFSSIVEPLKQVFVDMFMSMLPIIQQLVASVQAFLPQLLEFVSSIGGFIAEVIGAVMEIIVAVMPAVMQIITAVFGAIMGVLPSIIDIISTVMGIITDLILPVILDLVDLLVPFIVQVADMIGQLISNVLPIIVDLINQIVPVITNLFNLIVPMLKNIVDALMPVIQNIMNIVTSLLSHLIPVIQTVIGVVAEVLACVVNIVAPIITVIVQIVQAIVSILMPIINAIISVIGFVIDIIVGIVQIVVSVIAQIVTVITGIINVIMSIINAIVQAIMVVVGVIVGIVTTIVSTISGIISGIITVCQTIWDGIVNVFSGVVEFFTGIFGAVFDTISGVFNSIADFFTDVWNGIVSAFSSLGDTISGAIKGAINSVLSGAVGIVNGFISAINFAIGVINAIPGVSISKLNKLEVPQLAQGGVVSSPTLAVVGEAGSEAVMPLENNTGWISVLASQISRLIQNNNVAKEDNALGGFSNAVTSLAGSIVSAVQNIPKFIEPMDTNSSSDSPTINATPVPTGSGNSSIYSGDTITTTNNQQTSTQSGGDVDNSVTFQAGSIVIQASGASEAEAERMAERIMELIKRRQQLENMRTYKTATV